MKFNFNNFIQTIFLGLLGVIIASALQIYSGSEQVGFYSSIALGAMIGAFGPPIFELKTTSSNTNSDETTDTDEAA